MDATRPLIQSSTTGMRHDQVVDVVAPAVVGAVEPCAAAAPSPPAASSAAVAVAVPAAAAAPPDLAALSRSLEQLNMHFGALAHTLAVVVQQIAAVTGAKQPTAAAPNSASASVHPPATADGGSPSSLALPPAATGAFSHANTPVKAAAPSTGAAASSSSLHPSTPCNDGLGGCCIVGGGASGVAAQLANAPTTVDESADAYSDGDGALSDDEDNSSPSHDDDDSSSGEDEEAAQHANRQMQAQGDELENEMSVSAGQAAKEHSISRERERELQRIRRANSSAARPPHHLVHRNSSPAAPAASAASTAPMEAATSVPSQSFNGKDGQTVPASAAALSAASPAQSMEASQSSSPPLLSSAAPAPIYPAAAIAAAASIPPHTSSTSPRASTLARTTSPTLVPYSRRMSAGAAASAAAALHAAAHAQPVAIQYSENAVPLDAEGHDALRSVSASAPALSTHSHSPPPAHHGNLNPPHHARHLSSSSCSSATATSPVPHQHHHQQHSAMRAACPAGLGGGYQHQRHPSSPPHRTLSPSRMMRGSSNGSSMGSLPFSPPQHHASVAPPPPHTHRAHSVSVEVSSSSTLGSLAAMHAQQIYLDQAPSKIKLNVGGQLFATTLSTLLREPGGSLFSGLLSGHFGESRARGGGGEHGSFFIDRDPTMFRHILNYLRDGNLCLQGMTQLHKHALLKEARYFGLSGLVAILQTDARATKTAQRRELSSEKEYKLVEDVPAKDMATIIKTFTMVRYAGSQIGNECEEGYEFENWLVSTSSMSKVSKTSSSKSSTLSTAATVHLLFSKKLSRGELMLLDRLQNHM